ncbi:MAG TPA: HIT domain-containing protein [Patescibacteria group bacterium]|nr:HIT domain-containing protein [Patescibacteria group bacterium]
MDCIFCKIVANEIPSYTVYEDEHTRAFLDIYGATDGHVMVIPKKHSQTVVDTDESQVQAVFVAVKKVAAAIEKAYKTKILSIGINHGEPAGVKHLHVHIMPRYEGDGGGIIQSLPGSKLTDKNFAAVAQKLRGCL